MPPSIRLPRPRSEGLWTGARAGGGGREIGAKATAKAGAAAVIAAKVAEVLAEGAGWVAGAGRVDRVGREGAKVAARGPVESAPEVAQARYDLAAAEDDVDVVLLVAVELLEGIGAEEAAVGAHELVAMLADPVGDGLVVALASADERGAEVEVLRLFRLRGRERFVEELAELAGRKRGNGASGFRVVLHAGAGVEEAEVLGDLGDGGDGGLAGAAGDALLDMSSGPARPALGRAAPSADFHLWEIRFSLRPDRTGDTGM